MRVFHNTERGIHLGKEMRLHVGDHVVEFDDDLLATPGATFGQHLINAAARTNPEVKDDQGQSEVTLGGSTPGGFRGLDALVRVVLPVSLDGEQSVKCADGQWLASVLKWQSRIETKSYGGELPHVSCSRYMHALITMREGGRIEFHDLYRRPTRRTFWQLLRGEEPVVEVFLAVTAFSYDGKRVTQENLPPQKIGESISGTANERAAQAGCFLLGGAFGFMFMFTISAVHGSVLWWILGCAVFAACGVRTWLSAPSCRTSAMAKWSWAGCGAFVGAFVPYIAYCLNHVAQ